MSYNPNINDPRVYKRIKKALGFVNSHLSDTKSHPWSTRYIDKYLGHQGNDLSIWLRTKLLICTNDRYSKDTGICKEYIKNKTGVNELVSLLSLIISYPSVIQVGQTTVSVSEIAIDFINQEYHDELKHKTFKYKDQSSRLWHPLQRIRKEYKQIVFAQNELTHQYDIECCAPTLIHQHSQQIPEIIIDNKYIQGPMDLYLFALRKYLIDRNQIRNVLATETEITYEQAKVIVNALLMGAQLGNNQDSDIYQILNGDKARIEFLKQHPYIKELREDIKTCWDYIKPTLSRKQITTKSGKQRMLPISSKQKAIVYFDLERKVLNSIKDYMDKTNNQYFLEHDGFVCKEEINKEELYKWVHNSTGFIINLNHNVLPLD
jgi:hypothetical protein